MSLVYSRSRKKASVVRPVPEEERGVRCMERNWKGPILQVLVPKRKGFGLRSGCDGSQQGCWMMSASKGEIRSKLLFLEITLGFVRRADWRGDQGGKQGDCCKGSSKRE